MAKHRKHRKHRKGTAYKCILKHVGKHARKNARKSSKGRKHGKRKLSAYNRFAKKFFKSHKMQGASAKTRMRAMAKAWKSKR